MAKEAYLRGKRGLFTWQKRPVDLLAHLRYAYFSKETYPYGKRDLLYDKRDLLI
jgi:hypothetical protein